MNKQQLINMLQQINSWDNETYLDHTLIEDGLNDISNSMYNNKKYDLSKDLIEVLKKITLNTTNKYIDKWAVYRDLEEIEKDQDIKANKTAQCFKICSSESVSCECYNQKYEG